MSYAIRTIQDQQKEIHQAYERGLRDGYDRGFADGSMNPEELRKRQEAKRTFIPKRRSDWPVLETQNKEGV